MHRDNIADFIYSNIGETDATELLPQPLLTLSFAERRRRDPQHLHLQFEQRTFVFAEPIDGGMHLAQFVTADTGGLSTLTVGEEEEAELSDEIAVFPLAIPLIAGPASITAAMFWRSRWASSRSPIP